MRKKKITYMAKEIGLGPSLFLITTKELLKLFLVLSLINIPTLLFIYEYNDYASIDTFNFFTMFSLGNMAENGKVCSIVNLAQENKIPIVCPNRNSKIQKFVSVGFSKDDNVYCQKY